MNTNAVIVGIDEAGRGALAGPVVAGACILRPDQSFDLLKDSKVLDPKQREEAFSWITAECVYGVGIVDASTIDKGGILGATELAMQNALAEVAKKQTPTYVLVDGRDKFWFDYPHSSVIKGDEKEACISAGSILAKVTRDRLMEEYADAFPAYDFASHKGYGTEQHIRLIKKHGPCSLHRKTFLRNIVSEHSFAA